MNTNLDSTLKQYIQNETKIDFSSSILQKINKRERRINALIFIVKMLSTAILLFGLGIAVYSYSLLTLISQLKSSPSYLFILFATGVVFIGAYLFFENEII